MMCQQIADCCITTECQLRIALFLLEACRRRLLFYNEFKNYVHSGRSWSFALRSIGDVTFCMVVDVVVCCCFWEPVGKETQMHLRLFSLPRVKFLMPQHEKAKKVSILASMATESRAKAASKGKTRRKAKDLTHWPQLPKISNNAVPVECKSLLVTRDTSITNTFTNIDKQRSQKCKKKKYKVSKSSSETLVARLGALSISSSSQRIDGSHKAGKRFFSTFHISSLKEIAELIKNGKIGNVIVMAGAGISTPSGIPDFRSPGTGLYNNLDEYGLPDPAAVFDINFFSYNPKPFFQLAKELYPGKYKPNLVHYFVRMLHEKNSLMKMYTQNIDGLERAAGIPEAKLIEAHGTFSTATCRRCKTRYKGDEILDDVMKTNVPKCRRHGCSGVVKPDIVFFGEDLPKTFFEYPKHFAKCDLLIVLGTSLEVEPFAGLVQEVRSYTPRLLVNRDAVGPFVRRKRRPNDVIVKGDIVDAVRKLIELLGWSKEVDLLMKEELDETQSENKPTKESVFHLKKTSNETSDVPNMNKEELNLFRLGITPEHSEENSK
ncbi:NAD-dependent protein deacetylase sirtuin-3-like isoform X2 [Rhopilema esculentum]|uniref:NAD-dependent protein deacetylase sirtuin-3-like isoform X2 n=1 Tax=Rhopilema esculentum TaxID=499914 RepID=UPI0031DC2AFF